MQDLSGQNIKGYELHERIGAGGFGAVYRAFQSTVGREVAMKVILPGMANQPDFIRRFESEAQLIARLEHHHIVPLYDYWRDPEGAYLVMRWLRGGSLLDLLQKQGRLTIEEIVVMMEQLTQALHTAHRNQVIHRDIKPGNILLDEEGNAFLADFGIAKDHNISQNVTDADGIVGSPDYLSPEQARSEPVTPQTDIYCLGVVLYEMIEGSHPFPNLTPIERLFKHITEPIPDITQLDDSISDEINTIIQKATAKDPMQRFKDVLELAQALRQAASLDGNQVGTTIVELLTPREQEVLQLIIDGKSNKEIAEDLVVALSTVKSYVNQIYRKLNVRSRVQAIVKARELELIVNNKVSSNSISMSHLPEPENPYKGLHAFQSADEHHYFGRQKLIDKLLKRMQQDVMYRRFLAVVGPSGSGKSSVVKAGLVPALWRGEISSSDNWYIVEMLPGKRPIDELEVALLRIAGNSNLNLHEQLKRDKHGLLRCANLVLPDDNGELLIVIDQFEEVFTQLEDEAERQHFLDLITVAMTEVRSRIRVVITLRADHYDRPLHYPEFAELMRNRVETVLPLNAEELEHAIREPANLVGVRFEDGLVSHIIQDVHYQPGALPLLQYALTELFERRNGHMLTLKAYQEIGGTGGALSNRADEIYIEYDEFKQETIRQLFLRLVTPGEGAEDTRHRVSRDELLSISSSPDSMDEIIDTYALSRLLSLDHHPVTRQPTVEIAHEAILREWDRLRQWLNESRDDIKQERQLAQVTQAWLHNNRDASFLLSGTRLVQVEQWQSMTKLSLTPIEHDFIQASLAQRISLQKMEQARIQREMTQQQRFQSLSRILVLVFVLATIVSSGLAILALSERNSALEAFDTAKRSSLAFAANSALELNEVDLALSLALESANNSKNILPETQQILDNLTINDGPTKLIQGEEGELCYRIQSQDYSLWMWLTCDLSTWATWDMANGKKIVSAAAPTTLFSGGIGGISPDNQFFLTYQSDEDGTHFNVIDMQTLEVAHEFYADDTSYGAWGWGHDSSYLTKTHFTEAAQRLKEEQGITQIDSFSLWDVKTGELIQEFRFEGENYSHIAFSPDGRLGAISGWTGFGDPTTEQYRVSIFDKDTGSIITQFDRPASHEGLSGEDYYAGASSAQFSPDSRIVLFSGYPNYAIDIETGNDYGVLHNLQIQRITENPSPDFKYVRITDGVNRQVANIKTGEIFDYTNFANVFFSGASDTLVVQFHGQLQGFMLWDMFGRNDQLKTFQNKGYSTVKYSSDGNYFGVIDAQWRALGDENTPSRSVIYNADTFEEAFDLDTIANMQFDLNWSPDGRFIATTTYDQGVILWNAQTGEEIRRFTDIDQSFITMAEFTPDSQYLVAGAGQFYEANYDTPPYLLMWDVETGEVVNHFELPTNTTPHYGIGSIGLTMHPQDNRLIVPVVESLKVTRIGTESPSSIRYYLLDLDTGDIREILNDEIVFAFSFTPDGSEIVTASAANSQDIFVLDAQSGEIKRQWKSFDVSTNAIALSDDGQYLLTGSGQLAPDSVITLWNYPTGTVIRRYYGHEQQSHIFSLDFRNDGKQFVSSAIDGTHRVWAVDTQSSQDWLRNNRVVRDFTCAERDKYRIDPLCDSN